LNRTIQPAKAVKHLQANDPVMALVIRSVGPFQGWPPSDNPFRALSRSIIFQQLSGAAAGTIYRRFIALWGLEDEAFPQPAQILAAGDDQLRGVGLSRQKMASVRSLAEHFGSGELSWEHFSKWDDEEIIAHLTQVRGVGRWTAEMFLMFHLGRPDVLPVNDVGVNRAIMKQYGLEAMPKAPDVLRVGEAWRPWATVACWYLWRSEDVKQ
jgi:3-methyladenine DNA glycosylase/8-oxoguanine DNA glycosylase